MRGGSGFRVAVRKCPPYGARRRQPRVDGPIDASLPLFPALLKEAPAEAEIVSHKLMLRAGMIQQLVGRHLQLAAAGLCRPAEGRADRPRGDERGRRHRGPDADDPAGRSLARERPLRGLRQGDAAHQGPARARHAVRADQ